MKSDFSFPIDNNFLFDLACFSQISVFELHLCNTWGLLFYSVQDEGVNKADIFSKVTEKFVICRDGGKQSQRLSFTKTFKLF